MNFKDYEQEMPYNPYLVAKFYRATAQRSELYDSTTVKRWELLASTFNDSLMAEEKVNFVLSPRKLPLAHLEVVDSVAGGGYIHKRKDD